MTSVIKARAGTMYLAIIIAIECSELMKITIKKKLVSLLYTNCNAIDRNMVAIGSFSVRRGGLIHIKVLANNASVPIVETYLKQRSKSYGWMKQDKVSLVVEL